MCKGQGVQRFQKGNILEHLSKGKATEAVNGPREASSGRVRWGPVGRGKVWTSFYRPRKVSH